MWEAFYAVGGLVVAGGLAFGIYQSRRRNPANDAITETATKEMYADPDGFEAGGRREQLKDQLHPS